MMKTTLPGWPDEDFPADFGAWLPKDLMPDEKVLWVGRPTSSVALVRRWWPEALCGLVVTLVGAVGIVVTLVRVGGRWIAGGIDPPAEPEPIVGALLHSSCFLLGGFAMLSLPLRVWRNAGGVRYVLTDVRLVMRDLDDHGGVTETDVLPGSVRRIARRERIDGSGDLILGARPTMFRGRDRPVGLFSVENVARVEVALRNVLAPMKEPRSSGTLKQDRL